GWPGGDWAVKRVHVAAAVIRDSSGKIIAVLYVGFDYTDAQNAQFENLKRFRIGQTGSLALLDEQKKWLVPIAGVQALDQA
ncbi:hypothetical protein C1X25_38265, partial [Pseudomonas sp. GW247-3R2A]